MALDKKKRENKRFGDKRITLNIGGHRHETWLSTLKTIPGSRLYHLANMQEADESYDPVNKEYFFDRHPIAFATILQYYRVGELHMDQTLCGNVMDDELDYWGLNETDIETCCWSHYYSYREHKNTLDALDENFGPNDVCPEHFSPMRRMLWQFLEDPQSSRAAKAYAVISMAFVGISILVFVLETHPFFQQPSTSNSTSLLVDYTQCVCLEEPKFVEGVPLQVMTIIDYVCVGFFTIELLARFLVAPSKLAFWKEVLNLIDLICLIPNYIDIIREIVEPGSTNSALKFLVVFRIIRILRVFKLMKHYGAFKILVYTIKVSAKELLLMVIFLFTGVLIFASIIYYAEPSNFKNIPIGFWWALVTMTTVGYGDKFPKEALGYFIGCACVLCGVLTIAFTVPIVVNNFSLYYSHAQSRLQMPQAKKKKAWCSVDPVDHTVEFEPDSKPEFRNNLNIYANKVPAAGKEINFEESRSRRPSGRTSTAALKSTESLTDNTAILQDLQEELSDEASSSSAVPVTDKVEVETHKLMSGLKNVSQRLMDERRRQVDLIHKRREERKQQRNEEKVVITDEQNQSSPRDNSTEEKE
ncbi:potassium voltage-gated channel protein Shaw [Lingula anatina]|uniref:Potassium voltage-gated channel protein Shaw n=1 Tax=Lingula anatina TaxID=7574 RepID=A0A1S3KDT6_LINAN|nr:potassium voltage-gated channel protein Shaw [Lingula anatina]XP_013420657.1 potassium voltage-gated channel protein Shaw [Lingula anatina]|eukprot:XP_013419866.1 potassium voltage-gated channel protein Shaw [Lingula anatina]